MAAGLLVFVVENYWGAWAGAGVTLLHLLHLLSRWSLPLYEMRAGAQQGRRRAGRGSRLVGWWPMCGGLSEVAARLKAEAKPQHFHLVGVFGQRKRGYKIFC